MKRIADLIFEANQLKALARSGFQFLGAGAESVAEHAYMTTFIGFVLSRYVPEADPLKLILMCMVHDLPEARIGDINYVQKQYVTADEKRAVADLAADLSFGPLLTGLIEEFNRQETLEAQLAQDADQLSLLVDLKALSDIGYQTPADWIENVKHRIKTGHARRLCDSILHTPKDRWWRKNYIDRIKRNF